jgi:hypothetical protein
MKISSFFVMLILLSGCQYLNKPAEKPTIYIIDWAVRAAAPFVTKVYGSPFSTNCKTAILY